LLEILKIYARTEYRSQIFNIAKNCPRQTHVACRLMDTNWKLAAPVPCGGTVDVSNDDRVSSADGVVCACVRWSSELNFAPDTAAIVHKCSYNFYCPTFPCWEHLFFDEPEPAPRKKWQNRDIIHHCSKVEEDRPSVGQISVV